MITKDEAIELVKRGLTQDGKPTAAAWEMMLRYQWLVDKLVRAARKRYRWADADDLQTEARAALIDSIIALRPDSVNPTAYIWQCVEGHLISWCKRESECRLEHAHWQLPDESTTNEDGEIADPFQCESVKKQPQPFIGLIGKTDRRACNAGRYDTNDALQAFSDREPSRVVGIAQAAELWDRLINMETLGPEDRQMLVMLRNGQSRREVAEHLELSPGTITKRLASIEERAVAWKIIPAERRGEVEIFQARTG